MSVCFLMAVATVCHKLPFLHKEKIIRWNVWSRYSWWENMLLRNMCVHVCTANYSQKKDNSLSLGRAPNISGIILYMYYVSMYNVHTCTCTFTCVYICSTVCCIVVHFHACTCTCTSKCRMIWSLGETTPMHSPLGRVHLRTHVLLY